MNNIESCVRGKEISYAFCDDWLIYGFDKDGNMFYICTELWDSWLDCPKNADQESNAVEKYMLPIAKDIWDDLLFKPAIIDEQIIDGKKLYQVNNIRNYFKVGAKVIGYNILKGIITQISLLDNKMLYTLKGEDGSHLGAVFEKDLSYIWPQ